MRKIGAILMICNKTRNHKAGQLWSRSDAGSGQVVRRMQELEGAGVMKSSRSKFIVPIVSAAALFALSAHAQEGSRMGSEPSPGYKPRPAAAPTAPPRPQARTATPPQRMSRTAPDMSGARVQGRAGAATPSPQVGGRYVARGPAPMRDFSGQRYRGHLAWGGGRWRRESHNGRFGWWWDVGGVRYYYPQRMVGPPTYISEVYADDVPVAYAPPPVAYQPPPPPPPPADPGASALGGAIVGGLLGGIISGNASGAAAGAIVGGATGAIAGATAASRPGYYVAEGNCYYRYPSGQYVLADPRACY